METRKRTFFPAPQPEQTRLSNSKSPPQGTPLPARLCAGYIPAQEPLSSGLRLHPSLHASKSLLSGLSLSGYRGDQGLGARKENEKPSSALQFILWMLNVPLLQLGTTFHSQQGRRPRPKAEQMQGMAACLCPCSLWIYE